MTQQHVYVVVVMDPLDETQFSQLVEDLRALTAAHRNGCGKQHPAPGPSGTQQGREQ